MFQRAVRDFPGIRAAAICDAVPGKLAEARELWPEAQVFADFARLLAANAIDALLVETPAECHAAFCARALAAGVHVMSDIPPVASLEEAEMLWAAGQGSRAVFQTGANPNFYGWIDTVIDLRRRGLLGDPYYIECEYIHDCRRLWAATPWRVMLESVKYCTHDLGPVLRILGEDFSEVVCFDTGSHVNREPGQHDAMVALLRTPSGIVVRFLASFINNRPAVSHQVRIYGTKGYFEKVPPYLAKDGAEFVFASAELPGVEGLTPLRIGSVKAPYQKAVAGGHGGTDYALLDTFFTAIRDGTPPAISLREGIRMSVPGIYAAESARRGGERLAIRYPWSEKQAAPAGSGRDVEE
jgi:predicted dehydrogenase